MHTELFWTISATIHSVKIYQFFYPSDFTWNQFWWVWSVKKCHFESIFGKIDFSGRKIFNFPHCEATTYLLGTVPVYRYVRSCVISSRNINASSNLQGRFKIRVNPNYEFASILWKHYSWKKKKNLRKRENTRWIFRENTVFCNFSHYSKLQFTLIFHVLRHPLQEETACKLPSSFVQNVE